MTQWGAVLRGVAGGAIEADESRAARAEHERQLLVAAARQRADDARQRQTDAQLRQQEQQQEYANRDRVVQEAERAKTAAAEAAEKARREKLIPVRVRVLRDTNPEFRDATKYSDQDLQAIAASDKDFEQYVPKAGSSGSAVNPAMNSPEWRAAKEYEAQLGARYRAPSSSSEPSWQALSTEQGVMQVNPKTGETRPVRDPTGEPLNRPLTGTIQKAIATNTQTMSNIDRAAELIKQHPTAVGLKRGFADAIDQRVDPEGVDARAMIANVGSLILHDRSGAAVTVSEWPRLAPFIPRMGDDSQTALKKLAQLKRAMSQETELLKTGGRQDAGSSATTPTAGSPKKKRTAAEILAAHGIR